MWFLESVVKSPAKVIVGVLLVALFGTVALLRMPMQLTPEVQTPTITIETKWPGASPQEVEQEIVIEQEEQLKGVEGVVKMSSESTDSLGRITLEFLVGTPMERAVVDVIGRLEQVPQYPVDADKPVISTANASNSPIAWFILSARNPTAQQFEALLARHPELAEPIGAIRRASSPGLAAMRLRRLSKEHPELASLLPDANLDVTKLRRFAEDEIEARFERVSGISQSNVIGGLEDELQVEIDPQKLAARQLTISDVRQVLRTQNEDTSGGDYWEGKRRWVVRTLGQFRSPEQVQQQLLAIRDGNPVYLRDVAQVRLGFKKADGLVRRFGESSIAINALRETGANVLDAMRGLQEITSQLNEGILKQQGLQLTQVYDETEYIYESMKLVQENIFTGAALTMAVLMLFLHLGKRTLLFAPLIVASSVAAVYGSPWLFAVTIGLILVAGLWFARGALVVGLAIPTSIIGTFLILGMLGRSLNVVSLAGMAFAVGMLVDNAIVVLENIYRRWGQGQSAHQAAIDGTQEVWGAVLSSTLTTIAVFLPIVFIQEEAGQLFRDIALAISAAVGLSLIVAMTLVPMAAAKLLGTQHDTEPPTAIPSPPSASSGILQAIGDRFIRATVRLNRAIQSSFLRKLAVFAGTLAASIAICWFLLPKVEYLPAGNRNLVFGILLPPPGYNLDELMALGQQVESRLAPYWDVDPGTPEAAKMDFPIIGDFFFVARGRQVFMGLRAADPTEVARLVPLVQKVSAGLPGTFAVAKQSSLFEQGLSAGRTINIEITGPELPNLVALGGQLLGQTIPMFPGAQVRPIPSLDLSSPELHIRPKLVQAAQMGVSSLELGFTVNALIDGAYVTDYFLEGDKIDMTLVGKPDYAGRSQDIRALSITTPVGELVPLEALADVELSSGPEQINRRERQRAITIELSPPPEVPLEVAMQKVQDQLVRPLESDNRLPPGYRIELAGTADKLRDTWSALKWNILLALAITYLLMVALFESWIYPLVIILTVPMGAAGGILGLQALNLVYFQTLDVLTMLGFIILIGTVVNNPILIVHQSLVHMREERMETTQAILESVRTRIRPIFMTTITTVLGLLPLVLFPGSGSELYRGLGAVVLGGLLLSTLLTLVVVPATFALVLDLQKATTKLWNRKPPDDSSST